jgi:hypothetical protein
MIQESEIMTEQVKIKPLDVEKSTIVGYLKNMLNNGLMDDFIQQYRVLSKDDKIGFHDYARKEMEYYGIEVEERIGMNIIMQIVAQTNKEKQNE